jgi:D-3-phosphoglycerate dehydrogenase / 2-oxoglutarate reductase
MPAAEIPRALVTAPLRGPGFDRLCSLLEVTYEPWIEQQPLRMLDGEALAKRVAELDATVLIVETDMVQNPVFDLPLLAIASTRGDPWNVDLAAATAARIPVLNTPGRNADAVAEMAIALLFAVNRHLLRSDADVRAGRIYADGLIPYQRFRTWQLAGQTIGIVGLGAVGRAVAWRAKGLGMKVISYDPYNPEATHSLVDLVAEAQVISMHAPVTPDTAGMIGAKEFASMPDGAVFINTARAQLHDTDALVDALASGKLGGAGLDHFEGEFLPVDHPLQSLPNVVLTPHIGGATYDVEANQAAMVADDIEALLAGRRPTHILNPEVLG